MFVYRIENPETKNGPYSTAAMLAYERIADAHGYTCPSPYEDGLEDWRGFKQHCFGFASLAQLSSWFHSEPGRVAMSRAGWKPYKFWIDGRGKNVLRGRKQVIFNREKARLVAELDPKTLKELDHGKLGQSAVGKLPRTQSGVDTGEPVAAQSL